MSAIILESSLVHYEALGRGRPLLFLHDWLGSWRYWVPTMIDMSASNRTYALDFWGFGDSDKVSARYSVPSYVQQVELFMDQMGIGRLPIIGHGLGAVVAVHFALAQPDRVEQIMAISMPLYPEQIGRPLSGFAGGENPAKTILGRRLRDYEEVDIEAAKSDGEAVVRSVRSVMSQDLLGVLFDVELPVLLVSGQDDPLIQVPDEEVLSALSSNIHALVFAGSQHYPMLDEASKFNRVLRDFLAHKDDWDKIRPKDEWKRRMR
ncbi:MAG: alpha/beta fold hydrolase [Anaerolineae bacterium]